MLLAISSQLQAQCTTTPVKEAVRNGNFEAGYLGGPVFTDGNSPVLDHPAKGTGGLMDFDSDLNYGGMWSPTGPCKGSINNQYGVGRVETPACGGGGKNTIYGAYGGDNGAAYKDHTTGTDQGYALFIDFNDPTDVAPNVWKKAWSQTVDVYPNQMYYFSAWFTQYRLQGSVPKLRFRVEFLNAAGTVIGTPQVVGTATPSQGWVFDQFLGNLLSPGTAVKANLFIEADPTGNNNVDDIIIDDISFINSCQNVATSNSYTIKFAVDSINLCTSGGTYLAQVLKNNGTNLTLAGKTLTWYRGAGAVQTEITAWANQLNPTITDADVYRVCVNDPVNGCPMSATIVAHEVIAYTPLDVVLCSSASYLYDVGYTFPNPTMTIAWSGPSGAGSGQTYSANKIGVHNVVVTPIGAHPGCALNKSFTVSTNIPTAPTLTYCDGGGVAIALTKGDAKLYKWSTSSTMTPILGTGTSVPFTPAPGTTGNITLWMQSANSTPLGTVGATTAGGFTKNAPMSFITTKPTVLNSFIVSAPNFACPWVGGAQATSVPVTFDLTGKTSYTQNVSCTTPTTITPNWDLPTGAYTLSTTFNNLYFNTGGTTNLGSGTVVITPNANGFIGQSVVFSGSDACDPVPVVITAVNCCAAPTDVPAIDAVASVLTVCVPNKASIVSTGGLNAALDYKWQVSHNAGTTWTDTLAAGVVGATGKVSLTNIVGAGSYRLVVALTGNLSKTCVKTIDAVVVVKPLPANITVAVTPNKTQFCAGDAHTLLATATTGSTFLWKYDGAGTTATISGLTTAGTHNYKVIATLNGCVDSSAMKSILVDPIDVVNILPAGPFCNSDPAYTLTSGTSAIAPGLWSGSGISNVNTGIFSPGLLTFGTYEVKYTSGGACPVSDSIDIVISNSVSLSITSTKTNYCQNDKLDTIEVNTLGGIFSTSSGQGMVDANFGYYNPKLANVGNDTIWYRKGGACGDTAFKVIAINAVDTAKITTLQVYCQAQGSVNLKLESVSDAGIWSGNGITNGATGAFNAAITAGTYLITYTTTGACAYVDTASVVVVKAMTANIVQTSVSLCEDTTTYQIQLTGSTPGGAWISVPGGVVNATGLFDPSLATAGTTYKVYYVAAGAMLSCSAVDSVDITVIAREDASIVTVDQTFCMNDPIVTLNTVNPGGSWSGVGVIKGGFDPTLAGVGGPYTINYTLNGISGQCPDVQQIQMAVMAPIDANIVAAGPFCENSSSYQLQVNVLGGVFFGPGVTATGSFDPAKAGAGTHWINYWQTGFCPSSDSIQIIVDSIPTAVIAPVFLKGCAPVVFIFADSSTADVATAHWDFGDGTTWDVQSLDASASHLYTTAAQNIVVSLDVVFMNGCSAKTSQTIDVLEVPKADFTFDPIPATSDDPRIFFTNKSSNASEYLWNFGNTADPDSSIDTDPKVLFDAPDGDTVSVTLIAKNEMCSDQITKDVYIKDVFTLFVPNAFSPNGDGVNEMFLPYGKNLKCDICNNYEFLIFDRWGEVIFKSKTVGEAWNGKRANTMRDAEIDVYVWKLYYTNYFTGETGNKAGHVTLLR